MDEQILNYFKGDELAASTWLNKYCLRDKEGNPLEKTPDDMHKRLSGKFSECFGLEYTKLVNEHAEEIYNLNGNALGYLKDMGNPSFLYSLLKDFQYIIPGGSVMAGLGSNEPVSLSNCFVIGSPEDSYSSIMETRNRQIQLMKRRGGVGYDLSNLRPRGASVNNAAKTSTGAASFMDVCSDITNEVAQQGRRGALMLTMDILHPDIEEFITKKQDLTKVTGANISVKVSDAFMRTMIHHEYFILRFPIDATISNHDREIMDKAPYNELVKSGNIYMKKVDANKLWKTLIHCAWNTAEPGIIFQDRMTGYAPDGVYPNYRVISTNPCSEIGMGAYDSCRLMHINLTSMVINPFTEYSKINYDLLSEVAFKAMVMSDALVDLEINAVRNIMSYLDIYRDKLEYDLWNRILLTAIGGRRTGVGFTGLADMLAMLGIKYGKDSGCTVEKVMNTMFEAELTASIALSIMHHPFPDYNKKLEENPDNEWNLFVMGNFPALYRKMEQYGRRNISFSTVAPTGTVSILAGTTSGIEPVFLPVYERKRKCMSNADRVDYVDKVGEKYTLFPVVHPMFRKWAEKYRNIDTSGYTVKDWEKLAETSPWAGVSASEISWNERVHLQSIVQKYITHSISSTINLPKNTTENTVSDIYIESWRSGNKGQTIYRNGCREGILNSADTVKTSQREAPKRPKSLKADYYEVKVKGEQFIVLVGLYDDIPYEVFTFRPLHELAVGPHQGIITKVRKMHYSFKSDYLNIANLQEANCDIEEIAATLYSSMLLRHGVPIRYIIKTAKKVNDNISSFSSAMCRILSKYIPPEQLEEVCPSCGGRLVREGGCIHCLDCEYSKCL